MNVCMHVVECVLVGVCMEDALAYENFIAL